MKTAFLSIGILLITLVAGFFAFNSYLYNEKRSEDGLTQSQKETLVSLHLNENISTLSPVPEVLGGTYYVTDISFVDSSNGIVQYEDGHIALEADLTYTVSDVGAVDVQLTNVREAQP